MSDEPRTTGGLADAPARGSGFAEAWASRATWQQIAAVLSLALTVVTGGIATVQALTAPEATEIAARDAGAVDAPTGPGIDPQGLSSGLWQGPIPPPEDAAEGPGGAEDAAAADAEEELEDPGWSPVLFKVGFSFFMGFAIAFAVRSFVRISLVAIGMMALMLFGLEYIGLVTVEWQMMGDRWDHALAWLQPQVTSFRGFIAGQLPSAGAALGGLVTGWKRG